MSVNRTSDRRRCRPALEGLENRLVLARITAAAVGTFPVIPGPPGAGTETGTLAVLTAFQKAYLSHLGDPNYNPAFDLNHNGQIGQDDARILLHTLPPVSPKIPLTLRVTLAPQDKVKGHVPTNLGGVTPNRVPTVLGHTMPGALIFTGAGTVDWKLRDPLLVADADGNFSMKFVNADGINQLDFQVITPYDQSFRLSFPIYWTRFAQYENAHPRKT